MTLRGRVKKLLYGSVPGFEGSFPYFGTRVYFPKGSLIFAGACEQGIWEKDLTLIISRLVRPGTTYFDVGANIGLTSTPVLFNCPGSRVVSFEPSPGALPYLERTRNESNHRDSWTVVGKAVGETVDEADFFSASSESSLFDGMRPTGRAPSQNTGKVPVTTLDTEWAQLGHPEVSVIKIDVEGAELQVLLGATECIRRHKPHILFEWNRINLNAYGGDWRSVLPLTEEFGYRLFSLPNLIPVTDTTELEVQMLVTESFMMVPV